VFYVAVRRILRDPLDSPTAGGALPLPAKSEPK
jgi:hypothetical protein